MFAFECQKCRRRTFHPSQRLAQCCPGAKQTQLVNICLIIPVEEQPKNRVVHTSVGNAALMSPSGQKWVTACNSSTMSQVTTAVPRACTCYRCRKWLEAREKLQLAKQEMDSLEEFMKTVDIEDEENPENSIKGKVEEIRKDFPTTSKIPSIEDVDALLTKIQNLSRMSKERKILTKQIQLAQELKTQ